MAASEVDRAEQTPGEQFASSDVQRRLTDELAAIVANRATIDQAKGMLMALYFIDENAAFLLLRGQSQRLNIKLSLIAKKVVSEIPELVDTTGLARAPLDQYFATLAP